MDSKQLALITGVGKETGIGFETARQLADLGYKVIITSRKQEIAEQLANILINEGLDVVPMALDVTEETAVQAITRQIEKQFGRLDVLINNATLFPDQYNTVDVALNDIRNVLESNFIGAWSTIKYLTPLLRKSAHARIVNVSSGSGSFGGEGYSLTNPWRDVISVYSISKAALNALTLKAALDLKNDNILVNAATPGITATHEVLANFGGRPVSEGAASIVFAATLPKGGPTGQFFKDGKVVAW
ncbi:SDR family NAD(P)-dependent oxidoreductase [Mucilaginibacter jinjuensis]|uniref:SDR family NAD(P)-dependent oxidoreductase n=1 Tax=Mucilaginibacter jinjuensis TaxID=1176721 RepID=A0ABY7T466_9SPHI|nr:SDR family NAD(P)-dependent oxidoreductase [Mucilaginibacter jinjuensis]WCT11059.1 SDR family NAD(P)-dependent oxidoreductase [Mucilaginibacter jinjuensis]